MKNLKKNLMVLMFLLILFLPLYVWIVHVVDALSSEDLVKSFALRSGRGSSFSKSFQVGDILVVMAESERADIYTLTIYENSSVVFCKRGEFVGAKVESEVHLNPPMFNAGLVYMVVFDVYVFNDPIPGACFSDSVNSFFEVTGVETKLSLEACYDGFVRGLYLRANLTDVVDYPIANETVDFLLRFRNDRRRLTEGWLSLGSSKTSEDGEARLGLAFGLPNGDYSIQVAHRGNENFGESKNITEVEIFSNETIGGSASGFESSSVFSSSGIGEINLDVSSSAPYALLPMIVRAQYVVDTFMGDVYLLFFLDSLPPNCPPFLGGMTISPREGGPPYVYEEALLTWSPDVVGTHEIFAAVLNDYLDLNQYFRTGEGAVATNSIGINVQPCPSNLVFSFPEVFYDGVFPLTTALSAPRLYEAMCGDYFNATTLAPKFMYNGEEYVLDGKASDVSVRLYENGALAFVNSTDSDGLVFFPVTVSLGQVNFTAVVDSEIFSERRLERVVSFAKIRVYDNPAVNSAVFNFNCTVSGFGGGAGFYVGVENTVEVVSSLLNRSVCNLPVNIVIAKFILNCTSDASGRVTIPSGSDYLRVYNTGVLKADMDDDGDCDYIDLNIFRTAYLYFPDPAYWNPDADLNHDNIIDFRDLFIFRLDYISGKVEEYVRFDSGQKVILDDQGFALIPANVTNLTFYNAFDVAVQASIEFFKLSSNKTVRTNNFGEVLDAWVPAEVGKFLVQSKLPEKFDLVVAFLSELTGLEACTNLVRYLDVCKRPVDSDVSYLPAEPLFESNITLTVSVVDECLGVPVENLKVDFYVESIYMGCAFTNSFGVAVFSFVPRDYDNDPEDPLCRCLRIKVVCNEGIVTAQAVKYFYIETRIPTCLVSLDGEVIDAIVGVTRVFPFKLTEVDDGAPLGGYWVDVDITGINYYTCLSSITDDYGVARLEWAPPSEGTYYFEACGIDGDWYRRPAEARVVVKVVYVPVSVELVVAPKEFELGQQLGIGAIVCDVISGYSVHCLVRLYKVDANGVKTFVQEKETICGIARFFYNYYGGPYAFVAEVADGQVIASSPVWLTVGKETGLVVSVNREEGGVKHTISGRLLSELGPLRGRTVKVRVNDVEHAVTTHLSGDFSLCLSLPALNNQPTTYTIVASFDGDNMETATAYGTFPNGTQYTVCTTIQYGYRPASSSVSLTVEPQATQVTTPTKTPEQLQEEAEDSGWLTLWHEFTIWYPWYRLHFVYWGSPIMQFDVGLSLLPFGDSIQYAEVFVQRIESLLPRVIWSIVAGLASAEFFALLASSGGPLFFFGALTSSISVKALSALANWDSIEGLASVLIGVFVPTVLSLVRTNLWDLFLRLLNWMENIRNIAAIGWGKLYFMASFAINIFYIGRIIDRLDGWELGRHADSIIA